MSLCPQGEGLQGHGDTGTAPTWHQQAAEAGAVPHAEDILEGAEAEALGGPREAVAEVGLRAQLAAGRLVNLGRGKSI